MKKPEGFDDCLSEYGPLIRDACSGEYIGWGFQITQRLINERFTLLNKFGWLQSPTGTYWLLITKKLTREEAIEKYGPITEEIFGPRGGWKSVTFGTTTFISSYLKPQKESLTDSDIYFDAIS